MRARKASRRRRRAVVRYSPHFQKEAAFIRSGQRPGFFQGVKTAYRNFRMSPDERKRLHGPGGIWEQERIQKPLRDVAQLRRGKINVITLSKRWKGRLVGTSPRVALAQWASSLPPEKRYALGVQYRKARAAGMV